jgi:hypothetical protein
MNCEVAILGRGLVASVFLAICAALCAMCQEPAPSDAAASARKLEQAWMKVFSKHAEDYKIYPADNPEQPFKFVAQPVFRHDAPSRNSDDIGGVWVWTHDDGRPAVIGTVFGWSAGDGSRSVLHEFHTLSPEPIAAVWRNRDRWAPAEGVAFKQISAAPVPDAMASKRRLQMRQIARRFSAYTIDNSNQRWQLRLVPAPVYQWDASQSSERLGGAIFVICQDTNTDVVVCIEARTTPAGPKYFYACASFADWEAHAEIDGKEVWSAARGEAASRSSKSPHWVRFVPSERL